MVFFLFVLVKQLDLPFSVPFYRWLLYEEGSLGLSDLATVAPEVQYTLKRLQNIVRERDEITSNLTFDQETKNAKVSVKCVSGKKQNKIKMKKNLCFFFRLMH